MKKNYEDYGYKVKHGILAFQKGHFLNGGEDSKDKAVTFLIPLLITKARK